MYTISGNFFVLQVFLCALPQLSLKNAQNLVCVENLKCACDSQCYYFIILVNNFSSVELSEICSVVFANYLGIRTAIQNFS